MHEPADPDSLVVRVGFERRDDLLEQDAGAFYLTGHYEPYPVDLVRLPRISRTYLQAMLKEALDFVRSELG